MTYISGNSDRPIVGITIGDYNGIGPEVILKTLKDNRINKLCLPVVYGNYKIFAKYKKILNIEDISFHSIKDISELFAKRTNLITLWNEDVEVNPGEIAKEAGKYAFLSLEKATEDLKAGKIDALLTAPINKDNIQNDQFNFPGHTEYLAKSFNINQNLMMMVSSHMRVGVVTGHIPLDEVKKTLTKELIVEKLDLMIQSLKKDFKINKPKIALLGLNPHAGEKGLLGKEEIELINPIVEDYKSKGHLVYGSFPADGFFGSGLYKKYDGILAMYHDQGLIPFKLMSFEQGVNYTAGMPGIRTSPDHGTAYDLAGKNIASEDSFREALFLAIDLVKNKVN